MIVLLVQAHLTFIRICKKYFYKHVLRKVPILYEDTPRTGRPSLISLREGNEPIPVLLYSILRELRTIPSQWSKMKIFTSYYCNFFDFQRNNIPLEWVSTVSSTGHFDHSYAWFHHLIVENFVDEVPPSSLSLLRYAFFNKYLVQTWFQTCTPGVS